MTLLRTQNLVAGFNTPLTPPLNLTFEPGDLWAINGPNGSGKTVLVRTLLGLIPAFGGSVIRDANLRAAYIPQRIAVTQGAPARVRDIVSGGMDRRWSFLNLPGRARRNAIAEALEAAQADALGDQPFSTLSEGQKQRVLMARAFVSRPNLVVLDEPTAAMDTLNANHALQTIKALSVKRNIVFLVISHNTRLRAEFATHAVDFGPRIDALKSGPILGSNSGAFEGQTHG